MPQSVSQIIVHAVFSTKERIASIPTEARSELHAWMAGILKAIGCRPILINGTADHVPLLFALSTTLTLASLAHHQGEIIGLDAAARPVIFLASRVRRVER